MNIGRRGFFGVAARTAASVLLPRAACAAIVPLAGLADLRLWSPLPPESIVPLSIMQKSAGQKSGGQKLAGPELTRADAAAGNPALSLLPRALAALNAHGSRIADRSVVGLVDFAVPSRLPRLHIVDVAGGRVMSSHLVAHGRGSDPENSGWAERFSNRMGSEASSNGSFVLGETYFGKHGRSRRLIGLDTDNDQAEARGIVIHAAAYVCPDFAARYGRVGRSQGCFAVNTSEIASVLDLLGPGRLLYAAR